MDFSVRWDNFQTHIDRELYDFIYLGDSVQLIARLASFSQSRFLCQLLFAQPYPLRRKLGHLAHLHIELCDALNAYLLVFGDRERLFTLLLPFRVTCPYHRASLLQRLQLICHNLSCFGHL